MLAIKHTEECFLEVEKFQDVETMAPIACELCTSYSVAGEYSKLIDVTPKVLALIEKTQRERDFFGTRYNVYSGLCAHCVYAFGMLGNFKEGKSLFSKGLHFAHEANSVYGLGWIELCYGLLFLTMGDRENVIEHFQKSIKYLEQAQTKFILGPSWAGLGYGYYLLGDLEVARKHIEKGIKIQSDAGLTYGLPLHFWLLSMVRFGSSELEKAQECIEQAVRFSTDRKEKSYEGISKIWLGRILGKIETSGVDMGEDCIRQGMNILDKLKIKPYCAQGYLFLGELYADRGQREKAVDKLKKAEGMYQEMGMDYWLDKTQEVMDRL
jgi:tetratricopeptide (TPR) repeat protein